MSTSPHIWTCPSCGRRVPRRAPQCHCGTKQERADAAAAVFAADPRVGERMPWQVMAWLSLVAVAIVGAGWQFVHPRAPERVAPLAGWGAMMFPPETPRSSAPDAKASTPKGRSGR